MVGSEESLPSSLKLLIVVRDKSDNERSCHSQLIHLIEHWHAWRKRISPPRGRSNTLRCKAPLPRRRWMSREQWELSRPWC